MAWSDDGEVPAVERGDLGDVQAFGEGNHGCVGSPERQISVLLDQFAHPYVVGWSQLRQLEAAG